MSPIKLEPYLDIDRFFESSLPLASTSKFGRDLAVDLYERNGNLIAEMNLPGIDAKNMSITVEEDYLCVSGSREEKKETEDKNFYAKEIHRGSFKRAMQLPIAVDKKNIRAESKEGVLRVTLPIKAEKAEKLKWS